jgi:hypothetical protein
MLRAVIHGYFFNLWHLMEKCDLVTRLYASGNELINKKSIFLVNVVRKTLNNILL